MYSAFGCIERVGRLAGVVSSASRTRIGTTILVRRFFRLPVRILAEFLKEQRLEAPPGTRRKEIRRLEETAKPCFVWRRSLAWNQLPMLVLPTIVSPLIDFCTIASLESTPHVQRTRKQPAQWPMQSRRHPESSSSSILRALCFQRKNLDQFVMVRV